MARLRRFAGGADAPKYGDLPTRENQPDFDPVLEPEQDIPVPEPDLIGVPGSDAMPGRGEETPRERESQLRMPTMAPPTANATPSQPRTPTPQAGMASRAVMPVPFNPMPAPPTSTLIRPGFGRMGGGALFGRAGGLQGGGLGSPFDPVPDSKSNPIDTLMQLLKRGGR